MGDCPVVTGAATPDWVALSLQSVLHEVRRASEPQGAAFAPLREFRAMPWRDAGSPAERNGAIRRLLALWGCPAHAHPAPGMSCGAWCDDVFSAWSRGGRRLDFLTSGSTGTPKICPHGEEDLLQDASLLRDLDVPVRRIVAAVPLHHLFGFSFGVALSGLLGVECAQINPFPAAVKARCEPGTLILGFPGLWSLVVDSPSLHVEDVTALTASAPMSLDTGEGLLRSGFRLAEIYGSSESGVMGVRSDPRSDFILPAHWDPPASASDDVMTRHVGGRGIAMPMQDVLQWMGDRRFRVLGRRDGCIQIAGRNVHPQGIAARMLEHPGVAECAVRPFEGRGLTRLKAFVVPAPGWAAEALGKDLRSFMREGLSASERPVHVTFGCSLPRNALGKPCDWETGSL